MSTPGVALRALDFLRHLVGRLRGLATPAAVPQQAPRRAAFAAGKIHPSRKGFAMEHGHPDCPGFWDAVIDYGQGPKWVVCLRCDQHYIATTARIEEAHRQNDFALDMMCEAWRGAAELAAERMERAQ